MIETVLERTSPGQRMREIPNLQAEAIAHDLALMDELEAFVQALPKRTEGRSPTPREMRVFAYDDLEAERP